MVIHFTRTIRIAVSWFLGACVFTLTACGGGGGGDGGVTLGGVAIPTKQIEINSTNVNDVVGVSTESENNTKKAIDEGNNPGTAANSIQALGVAGTKIASLKQLNINIFSRGDTLSPLATETCADGGTITTPDNSEGLGDYVYDECTVGGWVLNGTISILGTVDAAAGHYDVSYSYDHFTIDAGDIKVIYDGDIYITLDDDGTVSTLHYEIPSLVMVVGDEGVRLSDYVVDAYENQFTNEGYMDYAYTVSSTQLKGSVRAETTQRIHYYLDADYPYDGQVVWTGANNSSARATVLDGGTGLPTDLVRIELDANGDGVYEESREYQWWELG